MNCEICGGFTRKDDGGCTACEKAADEPAMVLVEEWVPEEVTHHCVYCDSVYMTATVISEREVCTVVDDVECTMMSWLVAKCTDCGRAQTIKEVW